MKKKGFTLIELLAVIVVLAIIALIALIALIATERLDGEPVEAGTNSKPVTLLLSGLYDGTPINWVDAHTTKLDEMARAWTKLDRSHIGLPSLEQLLVADGQSADDYILGDTMLGRQWLTQCDHEEWTNTIHAYWTSTSINDNTAVDIPVGGMLESSSITVVGDVGIRPVITLSIN